MANVFVNVSDSNKSGNLLVSDVYIGDSTSLHDHRLELHVPKSYDKQRLVGFLTDLLHLQRATEFYNSPWFGYYHDCNIYSVNEVETHYVVIVTFEKHELEFEYRQTHDEI